MSRILARGWATVELERAVVELHALVASGDRFEPAPDCVHLGARCLVARADPGGPAGEATYVALLEPSTEGRLAVTLARHGEMWCATWEIEVPPAGEATTDVPTTSAARPGPFGPERLVLGGPVSGPHRLVVAATIAP